MILQVRYPQDGRMLTQLPFTRYVVKLPRRIACTVPPAASILRVSWWSPRDGGPLPLITRVKLSYKWPEIHGFSESWGNFQHQQTNQPTHPPQPKFQPLHTWYPMLLCLCLRLQLCHRISWSDRRPNILNYDQLPHYNNQHSPKDPCMVYLPAFTIDLGHPCR